MVFVKRPSANALVSAAARKAAAANKLQQRLPRTPKGKSNLFQKKAGKYPPPPRSSALKNLKNPESVLSGNGAAVAGASPHLVFSRYENEAEEVNFNDGSAALATKTNLELIRALGVYNVCAIPWIVKNARGMYNTTVKVLGQRIPDAVVGVSFFSHFCGGTSAEELRPVVARLGSHGVGAILDYAAEADVVDENLAELGPNKEQELSQIIKISEDHCEFNARVIFDAIDASARAHGDGGMPGIAAIKLTGMGRPELLERISTILFWVKANFAKLDDDGDGFVDAKTFRANLKNMEVDLTEDELEGLFQSMDVNQDGQVDMLEFVDSLSPSSPVANPLFSSRIQMLKSFGLSALTDTESQQLSSMINRLERVAAYADSKDVMLLVDAEQSYMQPAIDHLALQLMQQYNRHKPVIFNTYQCYLTDSYKRVVSDVERSQRQGFVFAAKLVRGAYMVQERRLAELRGYPDPIHSSIQNTHDNYNAIVEMLLRYKAAPVTPEQGVLQRRRTAVMLASHNENSVMRAIRLMADLEIPKNDGGVYFGQLQGMCDHVSYTLGGKGYAVYKYLPYGPVKEVMPYLLRRAEENGDLMSGVGKEVRMIAGEIKRRGLEAVGLRKQSSLGHAHL
mmetsp:Transcript_15401/g.30873  ORF Transcript_15401/g.30873 Transcript_15401/m.30873 type:complete len:623 (-) Transcript_15401:1044-2912(-)